MYELLENVGSNVVLEIYDKDNTHVITFKQEEIETWKYVKEHHFLRVIEEITPKDNTLVVKLKNYSKFEWNAIEEMKKLGVNSNWDFLHSVFFKLEKSDFDMKEKLKKDTLTRECVSNLRFLSKSFYNGYGGAYLVVLSNGEWFEMYQKVWGTEWHIGNHSQGQEEDYFYKYLKQKN